MALTKVVFADVSSLSVVKSSVTTVIEGANAFQASEPAEVRPIYAFGAAKPQVLISSPTLGSGSFSYVAGDGTQSAATTDWIGILDGTPDIVCEGHLIPDPSGVAPAQTLTLTKCQYQSKSVGMNAKNEMVVTVNFSFSDGLN